MTRVVSNIASVISRARFGILAMAAMAFAAETANDVPGAAAIFAELGTDPKLAAPATAGLALCALRDEPPQLSLAQDMVATLHKKYASELDNKLVRLAVSRVALAEAAGSGSAGSNIDELRSRLEADPLAHETRFELATALLSSGDEEAAVFELLTILKKERHWNEGAAKHLMLQIFESLGSEHVLTKSGRRRLANIVL